MFVSQGYENSHFSLNWYEPVLTLHFLCVTIYEMLQVWACLEFPALKGTENFWRSVASTCLYDMY